MAIRAMTGLVPEWFTPEDEKEASEPARFKIKPLDQKQLIEIQNHRRDDASISPDGLYRSFELSVVDWENVNDQNDKPLKCTRNNFKHIPIEIIAEVGAQAISVSFINEDDEKN